MPDSLLGKINSSRCLVLMSSYNGEKYIEEQIFSIFNQKKVDSLKLLIRDDGSSDDTINIIKNLIHKGYDIELIEGANVGFVSSFINLLKMAFERADCFDYFLLSDQDDYWMEDKITSGITNFEKDKELLLYCSATTPVDESLIPIKLKNKKYKVDPYSSVIQTFSAGHTYIFKYDLVSLINKCDSNKIYTHDGFIYSLSCLVGSVFYDETSHSLYRQYSNNQLGTSNKSILKYLKERFKRLKRGDFRKYGSQIAYIYEEYGELLKPDLYDEIGKFLHKQRNIFTRFQYILTKKIHRQSIFDDFLFDLAYLFGKYKLR